SPSVAGAPFTAAAGATTFTVNGTPGTLYTFTVTPTHPSPYVGTAASISATPNAAQVIIQDLTVVRPAGALVLTQRCGVYGPLAAEGATPGFSALPALPASADQVGTAPTLTLGGAADPQFANYPSPASPNYPTHCGVDLGTAQYVTTGALAGQYYAATGRINQVTVSDTRDTDTGWTVNGTMSSFDVVGGGASFSGNYLGWSPVVTDDSDLTTAGYDQVAVPGAAVLPTTAAGLATPKALASASAGAGLGIASFDARLKLLIPSSARAGTYNGTLTFTVV
ncbi:MAG: WxL domain-containing protein, partial [Ilumatobacteraceae bacterium]